MSRIARHRSLRLAGWVAAYGLALQALLFSFASAVHIPAGAIGMAGAAELCRGGPADGAAGDPAQVLRDHCTACFLAAGTVPPPASAANAVRYAVTIAPIRPERAAPVRAGNVRHPGLPRAPPASA